MLLVISMRSVWIAGEGWHVVALQHAFPCCMPSVMLGKLQWHRGEAGLDKWLSCLKPIVYLFQFRVQFVLDRTGPVMKGCIPQSVSFHLLFFIHKANCCHLKDAFLENRLFFKTCKRGEPDFIFLTNLRRRFKTYLMGKISSLRVVIKSGNFHSQRNVHWWGFH